MSVGVDMANEHLIKEVNESVTNNGVTINITSTFSDGYFLGLTFKATGENLKQEIDGDVGPINGYNYDLFTVGDDTDGFSSTDSNLVKEEDSYIGAIILEDTDQAKNLTSLPITFTYMGGVLGEWKFNVPVETLPSKSKTLQQQSHSEDQDYVLQFTDAVVNKASIIVNFDILKEAGIEGENLFFNSNVGLINENTNHLVLRKQNDTEKIIIEPYYKINEKEIYLSPIEINLK